MASVVLVTGLSGAGKSTVLNALEDLGYFTMDHLPMVLLPKVLELAGTQEPIERVAVGVDAREPAFVQDAGTVLERMRDEGVRVRVVFVDADDDILLQRYNETRRRHPLGHDGDLQQAIRREREILSALRERADLLLDTSRLRVGELQREVQDAFSEGVDNRMRLRLVSFGFKHGITPEADLVFDVRFLKNPFFEPALRDQSGLADEVRSYVLEQESAQRFHAMIRELLTFLLPRYDESGKAYLTVAIGCTGGQHRSVAIVEALAADLRDNGWTLNVAHRETHRWPT